MPAAGPKGKKPKPIKAKVVVGQELHAYAMCPCYGEPCPQVLVMSYVADLLSPALMLWAGIVRTQGAIETEGIFRLAGDSALCAAAETSMAKGKLPANTPPECLAHLIKSFLRHLPTGILGKLPSDVITDCTTDEGCRQLMDALAPPERAVMSWIIRVAVEVSGHQATNKMDQRNLALVLAPNLFGPPNPSANPMEELMLIKAATTTLMTLISAAERGAASRAIRQAATPHAAPKGGGHTAAPPSGAGTRTASDTAADAAPSEQVKTIEYC